MFGFLKKVAKINKPSRRVFVLVKKYTYAPNDHILRDVFKIGKNFVVRTNDYEMICQDEYYILLPGGQVLDNPNVTWMAVDDIPGLTDVEVEKD